MSNTKNINLHSDKYFDLWIDIGEYDKMITSDEHFGNVNPIHYEIGCGNGHFLLEMAIRYSNINFIGIDIKNKRFLKSIKKAMTLGLKNLKFIKGDGIRVLKNCFQDDYLDTVYINFPDPWYKRRHVKRRIYNKSLQDMIYLKLKTAGKILFVSDWYDYICQVNGLLKQSSCFFNNFNEDYVNDYERYPASIYEEKWRKEGRKIYFISYSKQNI